MSAFVVDPVDAQKPWQMSLGPLLRIWALGQGILISAAPKLVKSLASHMEQNGWHNVTIGNKHRCQPSL